MSRRITRSQNISSAKPSEYVLGLNRRSAQPNKLGRRSTLSNRSVPRSTLNVISTNISTSVLKEINNVTKIKPTFPKRKKFDSVDETQKVSVKSSTTPSSTKFANVSVVVEKLNATTIKSLQTALTTEVDNASLASNSILASKEKFKVASEEKKLEAIKVKSVTSTSSTKVDNVLLTSNSLLASEDKIKVASLRYKPVDEKTLEAATTKSLFTTSSKVDHPITSTVVSQKKKVETITKEQTPKSSSAKSVEINHNNTSLPPFSSGLSEKNVVNNTSEVSAEKTPEVITNDQNSTSLTKDNEVQHENASSTSNITNALEVVEPTSFCFKTPNIPLRRSARISVKNGLTYTQESSQIPSLINNSKIKGRRCTVHSYQIEVPSTIVDTSAAVKMISTTSARKAANAKKDKNASVAVEMISTCSARKAVKAKTYENVLEAVKRNSAEAINEIIISEDLKNVLRDDTRIVNGQNKLYNIPAKLTVAEVIEDYTATKRLDAAHSSGITIGMVFQGIIQYFEVILACKLLYESENVQYEQILHKYPGSAMSELYPPVYLLRLLVQFNKFIADAKRDRESLQWIISQINDFTVYLAQRKSNLFDLRCLC